jgi:hypothetical protein
VQSIATSNTAATADSITNLKGMPTGAGISRKPAGVKCEAERQKLRREFSLSPPQSSPLRLARRLGTSQKEASNGGEEAS